MEGSQNLELIYNLKNYHLEIMELSQINFKIKAQHDYFKNLD